MKSSIPFFLATMLLGALACSLGGMLGTRTPAPAPTPAFPASPAVPSRIPRTPTATLVVLTPTPLPTIGFPNWVAEFSRPILSALEGNPPFFQDDFPPICIDQYLNWKVCEISESAQQTEPAPSSSPTVTPKTSTPNGSGTPTATATAYATPTNTPNTNITPNPVEPTPEPSRYTIVNQGWFYLVNDNPRKPYFATIEQGAVLLSLPQAHEKRNFWIYNPKFMPSNFVLEFTLYFRQGDPQDAFRFQVDQGQGYGFQFEMTRNETWRLQSTTADNSQEQSGTYYSFPPLRNTVLIMAQGEDCAIYLDHSPLTHLADCRSQPFKPASPRGMSFHLLAQPGHAAALTLDNFRLWDLDRLPNMPK